MSGLEALLADTDLYLRSLSEKGELKAYFMIIGRSSRCESLRTAFATAHEQVRTRLRHYVKEAAEGCIRPDLDADAAALMWAACNWASPCSCSSIRR